MSTVAVEPLALSLREAAKALGGVSPETVRRLVIAGELPATRLPGVNRILIRVEDLDELLRRNQVAGTPAGGPAQTEPGPPSGTGADVVPLPRGGVGEPSVGRAAPAAGGAES